MDKEQLKTLMWIFTVMLVIGFILTFRNLNGEYVKSKYEGLVLSVIGLAASVFIGVKSSRNGVESFTSLFM